MSKHLKNPLQSRLTLEEAKREYLPKAGPCPKCDKPAEQLSWFYFASKGGWVTFCGSCDSQVDFFIERQEYFSWQEVNECRKDKRLQREHSQEKAKAEYLARAEVCPRCGKSAKRLSWFYFSSSSSTQKRAGWMTVCDPCTLQVDFFLEEDDVSSIAKIPEDELRELISQLEQAQDPVPVERSILDRHGVDGLLFLMEHSMGLGNALWSLADAPADCPWIHLSQKATPDIIGHVFQPVRSHIPKFVETLKTRCSVIVTGQVTGAWYLFYCCDIDLHEFRGDDRKYFILFSGGMPTTNPQLPKAVRKAGWKMPGDLEIFYSIHNGFGPCEGGNYIQPDRKLVTLSEYWPLKRKRFSFRRVAPYDGDDLLVFCLDGAGNAQCFHRRDRKLDTDDLLTVDWDHEESMLSDVELPFFAFLEERFGYLFFGEE